MRPYPISQRAISYVRDTATSVMRYTCKIERVSSTSYNETSLVATPGSRVKIYEGVCRVWEVSGGSSIALGDVDMVVQSTNLSIPWDVSVIPRKDDEVVILTAPSDHAMVGKRFQIQDSAKAGEMRATRRFTVTALEKVF